MLRQFLGGTISLTLVLHIVEVYKHSTSSEGSFLGGPAYSSAQGCDFVFLWHSLEQADSN